MKGIISGIKPMEIHDGDGIRTTVFFKGCPLSCLWCHNPESISSAPQLAYFESKCCHCNTCQTVCPQDAISSTGIDPGKCSLCLKCEALCPTEAIALYGKYYEPEQLVAELLADKPYFDSSGGGVTLSGGECLYQPDFAVSIAKLLTQQGVSVYIDTCGFVSREVLERISPYTTKFLYDIKAMDPAVHKSLTGQDNAVILKNLEYLLEKSKPVEIRIPLIAGCNENQCAAIGQFLASLHFDGKIKVLQYHKFAASRYRALGLPCTLPPGETTQEHIRQALQTLRNFALNATA